jgi:hypothetical protein
MDIETGICACGEKGFIILEDKRATSGLSKCSICGNHSPQVIVCSFNLGKKYSYYCCHKDCVNAEAHVCSDYKCLNAYTNGVSLPIYHLSKNKHF